MDALQQHELLRRLPRTPYPGLRPFLDHEDMLMHGRRTQVAEIVRRLGRGAFAGDDERLPRVFSEATHDGDGRTLSVSAQSSLLAAAGLPTPPLTRFVAVIGGSGSGKSSLIRAGVVPHLRQFGIPEVGDLWEPVVFTPGTNFHGGDAQEHGAATPAASAPVAPSAAEPVETPITRLAWRFESKLRHSPDAARREAITELLRRPGGLGRAIDTYGPEIDLPDGVDAAKACVLVVIDQFEELFHHSNRDLPDARALIERVIDHFHQARAGTGSPRCFLAITMRSEHLNDCAGYLGLPEAINAGAFLVSRLDDAAVRDVIEKPAQRFLRLRQRERRDAGAAELPRQVRFDPSVVERLVTDTRNIAHDPDHLPLLQHLLARMWQRALRREKRAAGDVPAELLFGDLCCAALADDAPAAMPAMDKNLLRLSLERWAEHEFQQHTPAQQALLTDVLRRLVYKDPASGTFNQQRLYVATHPAGADALSALLQGRWTRSVNYLFWDDDNPTRVTLKVSHESFIRGWHRLRGLADAGATQFSRVLELLAACRDWLAHGQSDADLLEDRLLRRMKDAGLGAVFLQPKPPVRRSRLSSLARRRAALAPDSLLPGMPVGRTPQDAWREWCAWLPSTPRGKEFTGLRFEQVSDYLTRSEARLAAEAASIAAARRNRVATLLLSGAFFFALSVIFSVGVQGPVVQRSDRFFQAAIAANRVDLNPVSAQIGGGAQALQELLAAAALLEAGRTGQDVPFSDVSDAVLSGRWSLGASWRLGSVLPLAGSAIEPTVNGRLRSVLTHALWHTNPHPPARDVMHDVEAEPLDAERGRSCDARTGELLLVKGGRDGGRPQRGIFITGDGPVQLRADAPNGMMFPATLYPDGHCDLGEQITALPRERTPTLMFDATMSHLLMATRSGPAAANGGPSSADSPASVTLMRLRWDSPVQGARAVLSQPLAVVFNDRVAEAVRQQVNGTIGMAAATWRMPGGRALQVGEQAWRIVVDSAQRLVPQPVQDDLALLPPARSSDGCGPLREELQQELARSAQGVTTVSVHRDRGHCLALLRVQSPAKGQTRRDDVQLRAYTLNAARSDLHDVDDDKPLHAPRLLAALNFGRLPHDVRDFRVGKAGTAWEGWLVLVRQPDERTPELRMLGVPWSTMALLRLGAEVLAEHRRFAPPEPAAAAGDPAAPAPRVP